MEAHLIQKIILEELIETDLTQVACIWSKILVEHASKQKVLYGVSDKFASKDLTSCYLARFLTSNRNDESSGA